MDYRDSPTDDFESYSDDCDSLIDLNLFYCETPENQPSTSSDHTLRTQFTFGNFVERESWDVLKNESFDNGTLKIVSFHQTGEIRYVRRFLSFLSVTLRAACR